MELTNHWFWNSVTGAESYAKFQENIVPKFDLKKVLNPEIIKSFDIARRLFNHSYFDYDFLDPAMTKVLSSFELAIRTRYKEVTGKSSKGITLQNLLYYFNDNGYFEVNRKGLVDALRSFRNKQAHPETSFGGGFGIMNVANHCVDLVNDTYENRELRKERNSIKAVVNRKLRKLISKGGMVNMGEKNFIIYETKLYFVDNLQKPHRLYGYFKLIFRLKKEIDEKDGPSDSLFFFEAEDYHINREKNTIVFITENGGKICFTPIAKKSNQKRFHIWKKQFKQENEDIFRDMHMSREIDKSWGMIRRNMHLKA